jgi:hypothetical protein
MPSFAYQNLGNLTVGFPIWRLPSIFINVAMREYCTFEYENILSKQSFPIVSLKMSSLPTLVLKPETRKSAVGNR